LQLDRERVHRDRADDPAELTSDTHLRPRQVAPESVRVSDRDDPDPGHLLRDEPPAVAGALARLELPHLGELAVPDQGRLETVVRRIRPERREAVERDTAAGGGEPRGRE